MSIQEMRSEIHHLVDRVDDESALEKILDSARQLLSDQSANLDSLSNLTDIQHQQLERAIQEHDAGKTVLHEEMKQQHREWLNTSAPQTAY